MDANDDEDPNEVLQLTEEALRLANTACHFDAAQNYIGACDYYDKCLLNMDEVLNKLPPDSPQWKKLFDVRTVYDDRMELLRETETAKASLLGSNPRPGDGKSKNSKLARKRSQFGDFETDFREVDWENSKANSVPEDTVEVPFWILKSFRTTIDSGGFLTHGIFIPKRIWAQNDVRISGLGAKVAAFEIMIKLITNHVETLYLSVDEDSLDLAIASMNAVADELFALQNQLSKPFPYIKELSTPPTALKADGIDPTQKSGKGTSISSIFKNVRKYAEVGFQRLVVALPSRLTSDELVEYATLLSKLCDKCQVFDSWYDYIKSVKNSHEKPSEFSEVTAAVLNMTQGIDASINNGSGGNPPTTGMGSHQQWSNAGVPFPPPPPPPPSAVSPNSSSRKSDVALPIVSETPRVLNMRSQVKVDAIRSLLVSISAFIRDIVVEILLRDIDYLLDKYMTDMRKSFSRMYWDEDLDFES